MGIKINLELLQSTGSVTCIDMLQNESWWVISRWGWHNTHEVYSNAIVLLTI